MFGNQKTCFYIISFLLGGTWERRSVPIMEDGAGGVFLVSFPFLGSESKESLQKKAPLGIATFVSCDASSC